MDPIPEGHVTLEGSVSPSEDPEKVLRAMLKVLADGNLEEERSTKRILVRSDEASCLTGVRDQLRDRSVRAAAFRLATRARRGDETVLMLNRQAASEGLVVLCGDESESPLGPFFLKLASDRLDELLGWLTDYEEGYSTSTRRPS